ncbi:hypothetical protein Msil_3405 [Methylocella silvestris BL2]|uniref:Uncharacterized protein n=1 Tax=Methylocella silvestris (strain DSM 15510 / CIP 108128 / LMG 27833 / NCIMB 13906 / BL2) TaxID=395965 RepID=B8ES88_METSB|nr:hypothetical protein [Methylocella silvestris]ACK52303.1 hypothetical protein Msil_3405 [Methylocella silvestris BL2]
MDPETIALLQAEFERRMTLVPLSQQTDQGRLALAYHLVRLAEDGERDPERLMRAALSWPRDLRCVIRGGQLAFET